MCGVSADMRIIRAGASAALAGGAALALYGATLAPTIGFSDSGELTAAAASLGVPHPPGFPLYILLAHPITLLPIGNVALRANFASAVFAALAVAMVALFTQRLIQGAPRCSRQVTLSVDSTTVIAALTAGVLFASLRTTWSYATIAEVYTLGALLVLVIWLLVWEGRMKSAAFLFGLGMGVHPAINVAMLPALAVFIYRTSGREFFTTRRCAVLTIIAISGLVIYAYLPIAAIRAPAVNWGDPRTLERLWAHMSGWQYRAGVEIVSVEYGQALSRFGHIAVQQIGTDFPPLALILIAVGAGFAFRSHATVFWLLITWMATNVVLTVWMNAGWSGGRSQELAIGEDLDAYYLPTFIACAILAGFGAVSLLRRTMALAIVLVLALVQPIVGNWQVSDRSGDLVARDYVRDVLSSVSLNGILLLRDWQLSSPMMYVQEIEQERKDVIAVDLTLFERRWYVADVARRHPAVFSNTSAELETYLSRLAGWEADPQAFRRDPTRARPIAAAFDTLVMATLAAHLHDGRVYATREVALGVDGKGRSLAHELGSRYQFVPQGLVFELRHGSQFIEPQPVSFRLAPVLELERRLGANHVVAQRVAPTYRDMLMNRGLYFATHGRCDQAAKVLQQVVEHDPSNAPLRAALARCR
jgi:hypothetical protein